MADPIKVRGRVTIYFEAEVDPETIRIYGEDSTSEEVEALILDDAAAFVGGQQGGVTITHREDSVQIENCYEG